MEVDILLFEVLTLDTYRSIVNGLIVITDSIGWLYSGNSVSFIPDDLFLSFVICT